MNIVETLLIYAGIPLAAVLVLVGAIYGKSLARGSNRYRPGRPWTYDPVWYLPHPAGAPALAAAAATVPALHAGSPAANDDERMGGASGEW